MKHPLRILRTLFVALLLPIFVVGATFDTPLHADAAIAPPLAHRLLSITTKLIPKRLSLRAASPLVGYMLSAAALEHRPADELALAFVWASQESGGDPTISSPDNLDHGLMQLRGAALQGHSVDEIKTHPVLAVRLWLRWLDVAKDACPGSMARALRCLSTGRPDGAPQLVAKRCALADVDCALPASSFVVLNPT